MFRLKYFGFLYFNLYSHENEWEELPCINQPRFSCSVIQHGDNLYCFGGQDTDATGSHFPLKSIEVLRLGDDHWESMATKLPFNTCAPGVITLGEGQLLLFGGWDKEAMDKSALFRVTPDGEFTVTEECALQDPDMFLSLGVRHRDQRKKEIVVWGSSHAHLYNEVERNWMTL